MTIDQSQHPSFNLWHAPWITLERLDGSIVVLGIEEALTKAHDLGAIYDPSPLVIVGIYRLLTAIVQDIFRPQRQVDLKRLWKMGAFPAEPILTFGRTYQERFDLFSDDVPFYQSGDLPRIPSKNQPAKSVAYLAFEFPSGTGSTHFRHGVYPDQIFCPSCAAGGLVVLPAFATSGGAGIKPSINGVPPLYVIPSGATLFESLTHSLVLPAFQPEARDEQVDLAWWARPALVHHSDEILRVGYLHSLTFPARRVRLYPEAVTGLCTRCGKESQWGVRSMAFEMGESRPKDAPFWFDPFAAYRIREQKPPVPIRPNLGKATWREFSGLFLGKNPEDAKNLYKRPAILDQLANMTEGEQPDYLFRCVGLRTDMKAKIFEWVDVGFQVPVKVLEDENAAYRIQKALALANDCATIISKVFQIYFGGRVKKSERFRSLKTYLLDEYWGKLAEPFRQMVVRMGTPLAQEDIANNWRNQVFITARQSFQNAAAAVGDDAIRLRQRVEGEQLCHMQLNKRMKKEVEVHD